jgi:transcriptional regulator with XRE-family HTH domain
MAQHAAHAALQSADLTALGARIRDVRRQRGLTQEALAGADISAAYVSRIEAGQRRPDLAVAQTLADRLDVSIEFLATGIEPADAREAQLALRYAELALRSGESAEALRQLKSLREGAGLGADQLWELAYLLGQAHEAQGDLESAILHLEESLTTAVGTDALKVVIALCRCYREAGDLARSIQVAESGRQRAAAEHLLGVDDEIRLTLTLVSAYFERGDVVYAAQLCQQTISRAEEQHSPSARASAYWNASIIAQERGDYRDALDMAGRALALLSEGDDQRGLARLKLQYGAILLEQDQPDIDDAVEQLLAARDDLVAIGAGAVDVARCDVALAQAFFLRGDIDQAVDRASRTLESVGDSAPFITAECLVLLGRNAVGAGDTASAVGYFGRAAAALTAAQADREVAQLWYQLGELFVVSGDDAGARDAFRRAGASMGLRSPSNATTISERVT